MKQVLPTADVRYFDGGHFVVDEYAGAIAETFSWLAVVQRGRAAFR